MASRYSIVFLSVLVFLAATGHGVHALEKDYFSRGQAVFDPSNLAKSRDDAIGDLMVHGLEQALESFMSSAQIGAQYERLEEEVLSKPERYVTRFHIFSETSSEGLYRIRGEVRVALEQLEKDLASRGFIPGRESVPAREDTPGETAGAFDGEEPQAVETGRASPKVAAETEESPEGVLEEPQQEVPREAPQTSPEPSGPPTYGRGWTEQDVLWAVSEKWNGQWQLPRKDNASRGLFASTVLQESEDRPWRLVFAETERLQPDDQGSVPLQQSLSLARGLNADILATGTARVTGEGEAASVKAHVSFFEVVSGRELGIIEEALRMGEAFYGEKLIELAAVVSVRFDRILQEASRSTAQDRGTVPAEPLPKQPRADNESRRFDSATIPTDLEPQEPGRWIVVLRSQEPYRFWEELERSLRERFGGMRVESFEMRAGESRAHLEVPGSGFLEGMRQARLSGGYEVEVLAARPEAGLVVITFRKGADSMPEASRP